jgi:hypothetical protein
MELILALAEMAARYAKRADCIPDTDALNIDLISGHPVGEICQKCGFLVLANRLGLPAVIPNLLKIFHVVLAQYPDVGNHVLEKFAAIWPPRLPAAWPDCYFSCFATKIAEYAKPQSC